MAMEIIPWFLQALLGVAFLVYAALGVVSIVVMFWFVKLLQAAVRALDRWQPNKPQTNSSARPSLAVVPDDLKYRPKV